MVYINSSRTPEERIVEIHGNTRNVACLECDYLAPMEEALERVRDGEKILIVRYVVDCLSQQLFLLVNLLLPKIY